MAQIGESEINEINLQEYLLQHFVNYIPNPSDESDFEDTTYEADLEYEKKKKTKKLREEEAKQQTKNQRETAAKTYFTKYKNDEPSIFNCPGIHFKKYSHNYISFELHANAIAKEYIPEHRIYHVAFKYKKKRWILRRFHVPDRSKILKIYFIYTIEDNNLIDVLFKIYDIIVTDIFQQVAKRKEKHERYMLDNDVELNSDDERLFFTEEERKIRKRKADEIWNRMLPPDSKIRRHQRR